MTFAAPEPSYEEAPEKNPLLDDDEDEEGTVVALDPPPPHDVVGPPDRKVVGRGPLGPGPSLPPEEEDQDWDEAEDVTRLIFRYEGEGREVTLELEGVTEFALGGFLDLVDAVVKSRNP